MALVWRALSYLPRLSRPHWSEVLTPPMLVRGLRRDPTPPIPPTPGPRFLPLQYWSEGCTGFLVPVPQHPSARPGLLVRRMPGVLAFHPADPRGARLPSILVPEALSFCSIPVPGDPVYSRSALADGG